MVARGQTRLSISQRRLARRLAYWNGAIWAIGNGLASTTLVIYLALELRSDRLGLGIGLIVASPHVVGLLRLGAPAMIGRLADRKRFCCGAFLLSAIVLLGLPYVAAPGRLPSAGTSLTALVLCWCVYHLLQYLGTVALWSWLADLVPLRIRGRFLGQRERWMVSGQAAAMVAGGLFIWGWQYLHPQQPRWIAYAISANLGVLLMIAALVPLGLMAPAARRGIARTGATLRAMLAPFTDGWFLRLLLFGCWFSFFNGVTQSAQHIYPARVLGFAVFWILIFRTGMRVGQLTISPGLGRAADRLGNRPVMMASLAVVALGPLFLFFSTPQQPWWIVGAWAAWTAYAGLNVCLPNLMLKLSPAESNTPYIATYFAVTGLCYAASTVIGGRLFDLWRNRMFAVFGTGLVLDYYQYVFLFGWLTRTLGVVVLLLVIEDRGRRQECANP